jgi:hypothetical protein
MADTNIIKMGEGRMEERIATLREARAHLITGGCHNDEKNIRCFRLVLLDLLDYFSAGQGR